MPSMYYQTSPVSARVRSPGPLSSPRRSRSPRVPSSSFYRPVGSPVARTIFPTRRTASTSPSSGTLGIGASLASHPAAGSRELNPAVIWSGSAGRVGSSVVGTSLHVGSPGHSPRCTPFPARALYPTIHPTLPELKTWLSCYLGQ